MSRAMSLLLAVLAVACLAVIGVELGAIGASGEAMPAAAVAPDRPVRPEPTAASPDRRQEWAAAILARPLFSPDRRPPAVAGGTAAPAPKDLPRLAGILVTPLGRTAIFAASDGGKPTVVTEGSHIGRFVVQSIETGSVTISGPDGKRLLRPSFDGGPAANPPVTSGSSAPPTAMGLASQDIAK